MRDFAEMATYSMLHTVKKLHVHEINDDEYDHIAALNFEVVRNLF